MSALRPKADIQNVRARGLMSAFWPEADVG